MTMYQLTPQQVEKLRKDAAFLANCPEDVRTLLKDKYCEFFSDKTDGIGFIMADKVLALVAEYNQDICDAKANSDAWLERKTQELLDGKTTLVERCNTLYQSRIAMSVSSIYATEGQAEAEAYQAQQGNKVFLDNEVTEELEQKLKEELKEVIRNNKVLLGAMDAFSQNATFAEDAETATIAFGDDASKLKAIVIMQAYLQTGEDGYLRNVFPENTSLHDLAYSVCASMDAMSVAQAVESGEISEEKGIDILGIIGTVIGCVALFFVSATLGAIAVGLFGTGFLALVAGIIITVSVTNAIADTLIDTGIAVVNGVKNVVAFGTKLVVSVGKKLLDGVKMLVNGLRSFFNREVSENDEQAHSYTVPEHVYEECGDEYNFVRLPARA